MKVKKDNAEAEPTAEQKESKKEHLNIKVLSFYFFRWFSSF